MTVFTVVHIYSNVVLILAVLVIAVHPLRMLFHLDQEVAPLPVGKLGNGEKLVQLAICAEPVRLVEAGPVHEAVDPAEGPLGASQDPGGRRSRPRRRPDRPRPDPSPAAAHSAPRPGEMPHPRHPLSVDEGEKKQKH